MICGARKDAQAGEGEAYQQGKNRREGDDINAGAEPPGKAECAGAYEGAKKKLDKGDNASQDQRPNSTGAFGVRPCNGAPEEVKQGHPEKAKQTHHDKIPCGTGLGKTAIIGDIRAGGWTKPSVIRYSRC
jgi:hypothetical protein